MSHNLSPSGDLIVTVDPSPSFTEKEKTSQRASVLIRSDPSNGGDKVSNEFKSIENVDLDVEKVKKSKPQRVLPFLYRLLLLIIPGSLFSIPIIVGYTQNQA